MMIRRLGLFRLPSAAPRCSAAALQTRWTGTTTPPSTKGGCAVTRLFRAVASSDVQAAGVLLDKGAATNVKDSDGNTPLHHAVERGSVEMARLLLSRDHCDVEATNEDVVRPLMLSVRHGSIEMVKLLLEKGANVNGCVHVVGDLPLHEAVVRLDVEMVTLLLEKGADVMTKDNMKRSPLAIAVERRSAEIVCLLLDKMKRGDCKPIINDALHTAVKQDSVEIARILIDNGAAVDTMDKGRNTPLLKAVKRRNVNMVTLLLEKGADVNVCNAKDSNTEMPLHFAVEHSSAEIVRLLIEKGADVNAVDKYGETPLHKGVQYRSSYMVNLLIEKGANMNAKDNSGRTPLHNAVSTESIDLVKLLIQHGADVDAKNLKGQTPLYEAVECGNVTIITLLIDKGADVNALDARDVTPLHKAVECRTLALRKAVGLHMLEVAKLLIEKGANVNMGNDWNMLQKVVSNWDYDMMRLLVVNGADVNLKFHRPLGHHTSCTYFDPLLHCVIRWPNCVEWAKLLIERGADVNAVGMDRQTPLRHAAEAGSLELVQLLIAKGATVCTDVDKYNFQRDLTEAQIDAIKNMLQAAVGK